MNDTRSAAGTLEEVRLKLWRCIGRVEEIIAEEAADPSLTLRAAHCLSQIVALARKELARRSRNPNDLISIPKIALRRWATVLSRRLRQNL